MSLHAAPINVADGLKRYLFDKLPSVVLTSATLCTSAALSSTACVVQGVRERVGRAVAQILGEVTIRDLLDQRRQIDEARADMFHI